MKHEPTEPQRRTVRALTAYGVPQSQVCAVLGICEPILRQYYRHELDTAEAEANAKVAESLFNMATKQHNVTAAIFWLKTRARWKEITHIAGPNGEAVTYVVRAPSPVDSAQDWLRQHAPKESDPV